MKRRDIPRALRAAGLEIVVGAKHTRVVRDGKLVSELPRHAEIKAGAVRAIEQQTGAKLR